ncbi:uncharacterized protein Pyn_10687 [Prunus yedoensis var. nudiflora]|uniref:Lipoyl-binding domain-containing protein n=1 Tax=Prunus yedoensis var. nudiflora TaxID=2094558 RepID=A0A314XTR7_PRUYE|nr:uncharacterized protein Pyn_10687 [Prunus yedoensis var. nudiflora]
MESSAVLRSFNCSVGTVSHVRPSLDKPGMLPAYKTARPTLPRVKNPAIVSHKSHQERTTQSATFPNGFEALMLEVCDETEVAELKLKVGDFEMHLKRNIGATSAPVSSISPAAAPPIPSKPMVESAPAPPPAPAPKSSSEKATPFTNTSVDKSSRLAALEASGVNGYVLVSSPTVGSFRRGRTVKGKKQPPICKEGDLIKGGQVIGYVDQFGTELPVKSDVGGEVLKLLFNDGEAVGYGDPLIAVLPSFHGINIK